MHIENPEVLEKIALATFSATGDGMHVEVTKADKNGKEIDNNPIITFREEDGVGLQVVIHGNQNDIIFPLSELKRAIDFAEKEVHCESFYD